MPDDTVRAELVRMFDQVEALVEAADAMEDHVLAAKLADVSNWILRQTND
jgi:hypothetical protein